ncbi:5110_t:CDS:2, partial [Racocetra fulgida]
QVEVHLVDVCEKRNTKHKVQDVRFLRFIDIKPRGCVNVGRMNSKNVKGGTDKRNTRNIDYDGDEKKFFLNVIK